MQLTVNGTTREVDVDPETPLLWAIREELGLHPALFTVVSAPAGGPYEIMGGMRLTGGSGSTRVAYPFMRRLVAAARSLLVQAAAQEWAVDAAELRTEPGEVVHVASGRRQSMPSMPPSTAC